MALSETAIRHAKPRDKVYKLNDGRGLYLLVHPGGGRYWRLNYSIDGKRITLALGVYPDVGLAKAREKREAARAQVAEGIDPREAAKAATRETALRPTLTFRHVADELIAKSEAEGYSAVTTQKARWLADQLSPFLGEHNVAEITAPELLAALRPVEQAGKHETAVRLRSFASRVFRYAIATGRATRDPSADLRGALISPKVRHRAAIVDPDGVGQLMRAIRGYGGQALTRWALELLALTFVRPGELRLADWAEFDLDKALWSIPAARMKMRIAHKVPLSHQAIDLLVRIRGVNGRGRYLFSAPLYPNRPMSENTLNTALRRMGYSGDEMTSHGFRAAAASLLNESGLWHADAIERQMAHQEPNAVRRAYARAAFWDERVRMMQWWADELDRLAAAAHPDRAREACPNDNA